MRRTFLILLLATTPVALDAQRDSVPDRYTLPRDVRHEVADRWNGTNVVRATDRLEIGDGHEVLGNVAVQHGPLIIAGHVTGTVLAINADVLLRPTARIDGELLVVGGEVEGRSAAHVTGAFGSTAKHCSIMKTASASPSATTRHRGRIIGGAGWSTVTKATGKRLSESYRPARIIASKGYPFSSGLCCRDERRGGVCGWTPTRSCAQAAGSQQTAPMWVTISAARFGSAGAGPSASAVKR